MKREAKRPGVDPEARGFAVRAAEILESIQDGFFTLDRDWRFTYVNKRVAGIIGLQPGQIVGRNIWENYPQLLGTEIEKAYRKVMLDRTPVYFEQKRIGSDILFEIRVYPAGDGGIYVYWLDKIDYKQAREALQESEMLYRTLFENTEDGFVLVQPIFDSAGISDDYLMVRVNKAWERQTGLVAADLVGKRIRESLPDVEAVWPATFAEVARTGVSKRFESYNLDSGRWYELYAFPYKDGQVGVLFRDTTERKQAAEALLQSEERLRAFVTASSDVVYRMSPDWREMRFLQGKDFIPDTDSPNLSWLDKYIHPDDQPQVLEVIDEAIRTKSLCELEHRVLLVDGTLGWTFSRAVPLLDAKGEIVEWFGTASDITERKRAEEALSRANDEIQFDRQRLQTVLETIPSAVVIVEATGETAYINQRARELYGMDYSNFDLEDHIAQAHALRPDGTSFPVEEMPVAHSLRDGKPMHGVEMTIDRPDGVRVPVIIGSSPLYDAEGNIVAAVVAFDDITGRKRAEEALRESENLYRTLFEYTDDAFQIVELIFENGKVSNFRYLQTNAAFDNQSGLKSSEVAGKTVKEILPNVEPYWFEMYDRVAKEGRPLRDVSYNQDTKRWYDMFYFPYGEGKIGVLFRDITDKKRAEEVLHRYKDELELKVQERTAELNEANEALREDDRQKNQFLASLSHELRNPLAAIGNSLSILERVPPGGERARHAMDIINRQTRQLSHLVDDLLDVTRISQDKITLHWERLELNELLRQTCEDYREKYEKAGVDLDLELGQLALFVQGDSTRLAQIFGNLLHNAAKFTPRGGRVAVSAALDREDGRAVVRVADTGIGIAPEMMPILFTPFMQIDTDLERRNGGLGLGLALVKGLVELHGGSVSAASPGLGRGSEFAVRIPCAIDGVEKETAAYSPALRRRRILLIEDNPDIVESLRELLELDGHEVETAGNGAEGFAKARDNPPEVLLCDIGLPDMDGYAVARAFREDERLKAVFLVALTGYAQPEDLARAKEAGFDSHLAKPVELEKLEGLFGKTARLDRKL